MRELARVAQVVIDGADPCRVGDAQVFADPREAWEISFPVTHGVQRRYFLNDEKFIDTDDRPGVGVAALECHGLVVLLVVLPEGFLANNLRMDDGGTDGIALVHFFLPQSTTAAPSR